MTPLKPVQAIDILAQAGFSYVKGIVTMACIGWAESRLGVYMRGPINADGSIGNKDGSVDRGWLQINSKAHPEVSDAQADDPLEAAKAAFAISKQGTSFGPWSTYTSGAYRGPEGLVMTMMQQAYTIWSDQKLLVARKTTINDLATQLNAARTQLAADESNIASLAAELDSANTKLGTALEKIQAAQAALA